MGKTAIGPVRHVFACIGGVTYERLRYKRRHLSDVAECDAEECRQTVPELYPECFPIVRKGCGNIAEHAEGLPYRWR